MEGLGRKFVSVPVLCRTNSGAGLSAGFSLDPTGFRGSDGIGRNQRRPTLELFSGGKKLFLFEEPLFHFVQALLSAEY